MDLKDLLLIVTGLFDLVLGFLIFLRNNKSQVNLSFTFFNFALAGWSLGVAFFLQSADINTSLFWAKIYYISASLTAPTLLYFASVFPENSPISVRKKILILGPALIQAILILIPGYLTKSINLHSWGKEVILGKPEYLIYSFFLLPYLYSALYILASKSKKYTGNTKRQLSFILYSILIASIFGVTFNLLLPWLGNYKLIYIGPPFTMLIFWIISYAIVKHNLLDFKLIFTRAIAYLFLLLLIGIFASISFVFIGGSLFSIKFSTAQLIFFMAIIPIVCFNFQIVRGALERLTEKFFYKSYYNSSELLLKLSSVMSTNIELETLTSGILKILGENLKISKVAFILLEGESIYAIKQEGFPALFLPNYLQISPFLNRTELYVFDEMEEGDLKQVMRNLDLSILKVLNVQDAKVGILVLGAKSSGEIYSQKDLDLLKILTPEVAIAIQNARSFDKIRKFNIVLTSEVKKATADLEHANARLKELDQLKDDFVSVASHELRTPMTAIRSYAWMALYRSDIPLSDKLKRYLTRTLLSTERLINLVNDMLNISRIESGKIPISPQVFDIGNLANDVCLEVAAKAKEKKLDVRIANSNVPKVFADPDKVHQILLNLVGNAMKFTPEHGFITVSFFSDGQTVEISVKDTGVGLNEDDLPRLFQKFGRLDNSYVAAATSGGTGLGLYISKMLIDSMHGRIWASSRGKNTGTTFTFSLPAATKDVLDNADRFTKKVAGESKQLEPATV